MNLSSARRPGEAGRPARPSLLDGRRESDALAIGPAEPTRSRENTRETSHRTPTTMTHRSTDRKRLLALAAILLAGLGLAGCSDDGSKKALAAKRYPVTGKVLLADGKPLGEGTITFLPHKKLDDKSTDVGLNASAKLNPDGTFETEAAAGEYQVKLSRPTVEAKSAAAASAAAPPPLKFPEKYLDEDASGLKATVNAGPTELPPFQLK